MNFTSVEFLLFFPVILIGYWILPFRFRWIFLLISSYCFYLYWEPWTLLLLIGTTGIAYLAGRGIAAASSNGIKKIWLLLTLLICLGCLVVFKYLGFLSENLLLLAHSFGFTGMVDVPKLFLPVGISFYTFQTLSYVIDVYKKDRQPELHFGYFALFVSYFPQLVAGPIERPGNLLPQLRSKHYFQPRDLLYGLLYILRGFFKKIVIADYFALFVDRVYADPEASGGLSVLLATMLFAFQIYCDFSGYSDIALGTAQMMGVRLMKNFDHPYLAIDIRDFWKRWHISLTSWFTDYIYIPLGGSRKGITRQCFIIMLIFLISGIWHGASWNFIIWGGIHGLYRLIGIWKNQIRERCSMKQNNVPKFIKQSITFSLVCFSWIFFRARSVPDALLMIKKIATMWNIKGIQESILQLGISMEDLFRIIVVVFCLIFIDKLIKKVEVGTVSEGKVMEPAVIALVIFELVTVIMLAWLALLSVNGESMFLYFQF